MIPADGGTPNGGGTTDLHVARAGHPTAPGPRGRATVDGLTIPLVVAHRGGANLFPENTLAAYEGAAALGCQAIEAGDLQLTADGGLVAMHDATVDRTTTGSGNVGDFTVPGIRTLTVDASVWFGGRWVDQPVPTFAQILDRLGGEVVLVPESKSMGPATTLAIIDAVAARGLQDSVIIQSFRLPEVALVSAAGIAPLYLMDSGTEATPSAIVEAGARFVGLHKDAVDFTRLVGALQAVGLRVLAWTVDTQVEYDRVAAAGCDGIITNEPLYAARDYAYRSHRAPWRSDGTYSHGMLVYPGVGPLVAHAALRGGRGPFIGVPGAWRWALIGTPSLAGPVCPVADAAGSYTVTVQLVFDRPPAADRTRWGGIYVGVTTDECPDDVDTSTGYLVALRWTGDLAVFGQPAAGTGMACLGSTPTSAIVTPVLSAALPAGAAVTSLPVHALPADVRPGHQFLLPTGQVATLAAVTAAGGRALPIERLVPSAPLAAGTALAQTVTIAVAKTPAGLTVSRTDDGVTAGYADSTWSGGYLFLRNDGDDVAAISCASLTISAPRRQS
jgi:glycerophosphoryl diester phosphodiesterase